MKTTCSEPLGDFTKRLEKGRERLKEQLSSSHPLGVAVSKGSSHSSFHPNSRSLGGRELQGMGLLYDKAKGTIVCY